MSAITTKIKTIAKGSLLSYSQILFAENTAFSILLFIASFIDFYVGLAGLVSVIIANLLALVLGYSHHKISSGLYGFNALLVGMGIGLNYDPSVNLFILIALTAVLTLFITLSFEGILSKYGLPFLGLPFLISIWIVSLSFSQFSNLIISERNIYTANELYGLGGLWLVNLSDSISHFLNNTPWQTYFLSLSAIFFQYSLITGIIIAFLLFIHSRVLFLYSLLGFFSAYLFYGLLGADTDSLNYTYYGFNFILSSLAIAYFYKPSTASVITTIILIPVIVIITLAADSFFSIFHISAYAFPFVISILGLMYALSLRLSPKVFLYRIPIQQEKPEFNKYYYEINLDRFGFLNYYPINLPFWGKWTVTQGHNGEYTHKEEWQYAWDFVIKDEEGKEFENEGYKPEDYKCYGKPVVAPAPGIIVAAENNIPDNAIGEVDTSHNWGNTIVIKHTEYLYSQLSHLQPGSIKVKTGDFVSKGQVLANCGNSGRSPYPHLHFQLQSLPYIGSPTIFFKLSNYLKHSKNKTEIIETGIPQENEVLENITETKLLKNCLTFVPGQKLEFTYLKNNIKQQGVFEANTDIYNNNYLYETESNSYLYYLNNGTFFITQNYKGKKSSPLFLLYLTVRKIMLAYYENIIVEDIIPVHQAGFPKPLRIIQDFFSPFFLFSKSSYKIKYTETDNSFSPAYVKLNGEIKNTVFGKSFSTKRFEVTISRNEIKIDTFENHKTLIVKCKR